jgi:EF-P beta-lysylation protein EpmB
MNAIWSSLVPDTFDKAGHYNRSAFSEKNPETHSMDRWQNELADSFTDPGELLRFLGLDVPEDRRAEAERSFAFRVTRSYAARMVPGDPADPLLRQVLPSGAELTQVAGFNADPVGDLGAVAVPGVLHKYHGRALLLPTGACAIACRYCFRRDFPYPDLQLGKAAESDALAYLARDVSIEEVILSGGDPLLLGDRRLVELFENLAAIPHLRRVRVHSRVPVVLPSRVTEGLMRGLTGTRLAVVLVIHANHPNELDGEVAGALTRWRGNGSMVLNQSVLLRGINDDPEVLVQLSERLFCVGALPYYLHLLDRAAGTAHFEVEPERASQLHRHLCCRLPGYLVPRLVREDSGAPHKTLL